MAVLDWGLGHASRCVPLIRQWQADGKEVYIVCSGAALIFLQKECPEAQYLKCTPYAIRYPTSSMVINMAWQSIRIARVIVNEYRQMKKWVADIQPDLIVSDGRFGCFHPSVKSIWLAHQLQIQHPFWPLAAFLNNLYHPFIRKHFQAIWVPDYGGMQALSGRLSDPISGISHHFLAPLSRYSSIRQQENKPSYMSKKYRYLALLSGPEPQRSFLEKELLSLLEKQTDPCLLVRGVTDGSSSLLAKNDRLQIIDCLYGDELYAHVAATEQLICRSGYSSLMDIYYWQKPVILIPTPGQTEQLYLAKYWAEKGWAQWQEQGRVNI